MIALASSVSIGDLVALIAALSAATVNVINAIRARERDDVTQGKVDALHQEVRPPSNGKTAGALLESVAYGQHVLASVEAVRAGVDPPPPIVQPADAPIPPRPDGPPPGFA